MQEADLMHKPDLMLTKESITLEERLELKDSSYSWLKCLYLVKGLFIRSGAKWIDEGKKNTKDFSSSQKINLKRKSLTGPHNEGEHCMNPYLTQSLCKFPG